MVLICKNEKLKSYHKGKRGSTEFTHECVLHSKKKPFGSHLNTPATYTNTSESQKQI